MLDISVHANAASPAPLAEIAKRQGLSSGLLEQLFRSLKKAGLVEPVRGVRGGYRLAKGPEHIHLLEILVALSEPAVMAAKRRSVKDAESAVVEAALNKAGIAFSKAAGSITLAQMKKELRDTPGSIASPSRSARFSI